ncbi:MAG: aminoacyl-tRNA hydrolase [Planctomycetota bacterium]|jgi:PTH1 family peptidyl-tRNA hydrolase
MKLIAGLGNPGRQYDQTRHNVGYVVLDRLARRYASGATARRKFHGAVLDASINGRRVVLLKPATFMNRSGEPVGEAVRFYRLPPAADLLVLVDDTALSCGMIRLRISGGAGGHNGLEDIEQKLATDEYARLRIGIDAPGEIPSREYVLGRFRPDQLEPLEPALEDAVAAAACWVTHGIHEAMNRFNRRKTA